MCKKKREERESEREREREKLRSKKQPKQQQTKKKKKERTRVIFDDVKAFFSILISREESQLQSSQKHTTKQEQIIIKSHIYK